MKTIMILTMIKNNDYDNNNNDDNDDDNNNNNDNNYYNNNDEENYSFPTHNKAFRHCTSSPIKSHRK